MAYVPIHNIPWRQHKNHMHIPCPVIFPNFPSATQVLGSRITVRTTEAKRSGYICQNRSEPPQRWSFVGMSMHHGKSRECELSKLMSIEMITMTPPSNLSTQCRTVNPNSNAHVHRHYTYNLLQQYSYPGKHPIQNHTFEY